jgi:hypothetical protein
VLAALLICAFIRFIHALLLAVFVEPDCSGSTSDRSHASRSRPQEVTHLTVQREFTN